MYKFVVRTGNMEKEYPSVKECFDHKGPTGQVFVIWHKSYFPVLRFGEQTYTRPPS